MSGDMETIVYPWKLSIVVIIIMSNYSSNLFFFGTDSVSTEGNLTSYTKE